MKVFKVPVIMRKETQGYIEVIAESMDKAESVILSQSEIACIFNSYHVDDVSFLIVQNKSNNQKQNY